jgi:hypothetical protein
LSLSADEPRTQDVEVYLTLMHCRPKAERLAAFEDHVARMRTWEKKFRPLAGNGTLSTLDFLELQARRLQAEAWLAREKLKSDGGQARTL